MQEANVNGVRFYNSDNDEVVRQVEDDNFESSYEPEIYDYPSGNYDDGGSSSIKAIPDDEDDDEYYEEDGYEEDDDSDNYEDEPDPVEETEKSIDEAMKAIKNNKANSYSASLNITASPKQQREASKLTKSQKDTIIWAKNHFISSIMNAILSKTDENAIMFVKQMEIAAEAFCDQMRLANVKYAELSKEDYEFLGFHSWRIDMPGEYFNKVIMLIPIELVKLIDAATEVYSIYGKKVPFRPEELDLDTRGGCLAYGFLLDK